MFCWSNVHIASLIVPRISPRFFTTQHSWIFVKVWRWYIHVRKSFGLFHWTVPQPVSSRVKNCLYFIIWCSAKTPSTIWLRGHFHYVAYFLSNLQFGNYCLLIYFNFYYITDSVISKAKIIWIIHDALGKCKFWEKNLIFWT